MRHTTYKRDVADVRLTTHTAAAGIESFQRANHDDSGCVGEDTDKAFPHLTWPGALMCSGPPRHALFRFRLGGAIQQET